MAAAASTVAPYSLTINFENSHGDKSNVRCMRHGQSHPVIIGLDAPLVDSIYPLTDPNLASCSKPSTTRHYNITSLPISVEVTTHYPVAITIELFSRKGIHGVRASSSDYSSSAAIKGFVDFTPEEPHQTVNVKIVNCMTLEASNVEKVAQAVIAETEE